MAKKNNKIERVKAEIMDDSVSSKKTYKQKVTMTVENEVIEGYTDVKLPTKHRLNNGSFLVIFQKAMYNIATMVDLTKNEMKLLIYLLGSAGIDNSVCIDLNVLSEDLSLNKGNVSRALKGLVTRNIVLRRDGYRYGTNPLPFELKLNYDQINYNVAYNGKIKEFKVKHLNHPIILDEPEKMQIIETSLNFDAPEEPILTPYTPEIINE